MSSTAMTTSSASGGTASSSLEVVNGYQIPKWAGKPPSGLHLDIMKEGKMIQKLMIDEKKYYFFGRNKDVCDFVTDHASCSRVHAVLIWHKHLNRSFLVDLGSAHGTYIGSIRLEAQKPQQVFIDSELKFGASTRTYIIRERPQVNKHFPSILAGANSSSSVLNNSTGDANENSFSYDKDDPNNLSASYLPESEAELDNLTEFNTAHNKRIAQLVDLASTNTGNAPTNLMGAVTVKRKKKTVVFNEEEEVINPEDIDPTVGRFRNMIQTSIVIPNKKKRPNQMQYSSQFQPAQLTESQIKRNKVENDEDEDEENEESCEANAKQATKLLGYSISNTIASNLGISMPDLAPDVDNPTVVKTTNPFEQHSSYMLKQQQLEFINRQYQQQQPYHYDDETYEDETSEKKKKYAKEAWPGRKPSSTSNQQSDPLAATTSFNTSSSKSAPMSTSTAPKITQSPPLADDSKAKSKLQPSTSSPPTAGASQSSGAGASAKRLII